MTDRILGFQVVLLDEQGVELQRIPDVYYDDADIVIDGCDYILSGVAMEGGQRVRYFMPASKRGRDRVTTDIVAELAKHEDVLSRAQAGIWEGTPSGQTLFGYPIIYSDKLPVGEITFGPADENWARRYFGLPPKES
jgi:hypothetical protein